VPPIALFGRQRVLCRAALLPVFAASGTGQLSK